MTSVTLVCYNEVTKLKRGYEMQKNNAIRHQRYKEIKKLSEISNIDMSVLVTLAWDYFKTSKQYSRLMLGLEDAK